MASDYLDRDLGWWSRTQMRMHLALCRHCRRYVEQIETALTLLRDLRLSEPESVDEIVKQLHARVPRSPGS